MNVSDSGIKPAIELLEPVRECTMTLEYAGYPCNDYRCSARGKVHCAPRTHERCPRCGAVVTRTKGETACPR